MFGKGRSVQGFTIDEMGILARYLNINHVPCAMHSPFRADKHRSFAFYVSANGRIRYKDFATGENGDLMSFMCRYLNKNKNELIQQLCSEGLCGGDVYSYEGANASLVPKQSLVPKEKPVLKCRVREWMDYDIKYWESYGVNINLLKRCSVFPIDYKFITSNGITRCFKADKYAYAFAERKDGKLTFKFYQPFNSRYKWQSSHDRSVIGLWTCIPDKGESVCICSSVKDALCLWSNMRIPCVCLQGEGYTMSKTASDSLRNRFDNVFVCFDNDLPGLKYAEKFCALTGFTNVVIPQFDGGKDISDFYKTYGHDKFMELFTRIMVK